MSKISIVKGENRKENIIRAIKLIEDEIEKAIKDKKSKQLFIKINAIDSNFPLACTHIDALDAVLSIFYDRFDEIIIGDNSFVFTKNKGGPYREILNRYPNVKLSDLNEFETKNIEFKKINGEISIGKFSLLPSKAFTISLALPKTHDTFVYTGCLKNMFGCVIKNRGDLHALKLYERVFLNKYVRSNKLKWDNLVNVIKQVKPDLCILDAYEGMEGEGPLFGTSIQVGIAMCSLDGIDLDRLASKICGLDYVPYLFQLSNRPDNPEITKEGFEKIGKITKKFKLHYNNKYQLPTSKEFLMPILDIGLMIPLLKRSYRIKDKLIEKFRSKNAIN